MKKVLLEVKDLKKYFKTKKGMLHAVDGVNFSIEEGKTLGIVGESGCGKTTTGRTVLRLIEPTSGEIWFDGKNITNCSKKEMRLLRRDMQLIFQDPFSSLDPRYTVNQLIREPIVLNKILTNKEEIEQAADCDLVIEAIIENMEIKSSVFRQLDTICKPETVFATNTSSLPITSIAAVTKRPEKVIGMHFMNPVPVMTLVEVIRGLETNQKTLDFVFNTSREMGKVPIEVRDVPGFISNRVLQVMINEAIYCVYEGVASPEGIDEIMKRGMGHPMGPLQLADFIGLDTILYVLEIMFEGYGDPKYRPCPLLRQYVAAGRFGKKSGRGFYEYN